MVHIRPYKNSDATEFKALNIAWLEKYFYVEVFDNEVLSNPDTYILNKEGYIFMVTEDEKTIGTMSLMKHEDGIFEFTKMAVDPNFQGRGIGKEMMLFCIDFAKTKHFKKLILYSNTVLENAIYIYRKFGFIEVPIETDVVYARGNIKMEHYLE
ncbi:MAG: GNAT superfamily N-acetyltransferase [Flavobacteriales bacterium]|jgi:GNAT superfamily N-acetyltransferase